MAEEIPDETKKQILKLWRTPSFAGSFTGLATFQSLLALDKNIHISRTRLFQIMQRDEDFVLETKKRRKTFPRRKMIVHGFGKL